MLIYDSHCHLEDALSHHSHLTEALIPGVTLNDVPKLVKLRYNYPLYKIGFGIHPWYIDQYAQYSDLKTELKQLILQHKPDFIGETGLDYLKPDKTLQHDLLVLQLQLAREFKLPVILHCVKAYNELLAALKSERISCGIIHGFNANKFIAKQFIEQGFLLGIGSLITKNSIIHNNLTAIPYDKLVLESDAPFMPAFNQAISKSQDTLLYAQIIARQYNLNLIDLINQSNLNVKNLFRN